MSNLTENDDGSLNAQGKRITNGAKATTNTDLITRGQAIAIAHSIVPTFRIENGALIVQVPEWEDIVEAANNA